MIKVTNINDKLALKVCLAITHKIVIEPGSVSARCRDAVLIVEQDHGIPAGRYLRTYRHNRKANSRKTTLPIICSGFR